MSASEAKHDQSTREPIYPLVLVHGLLGFSTIGPRRRLEYFRGVMRHLENNPEVLNGRGKVYVADLDPLDTIPSRAIQLRDFIQERIYDHQEKKFWYEKVNIIAHSMGGLDARYMISTLSMDTGSRSPMAEWVASLTTIGTPHRGTPFADFMMQLPVGQRIIQWAACTFGDGLVLSTSFGIQAALMLHLATQVVPDLPVVWVDTGYLPSETTALGMSALLSNISAIPWEISFSMDEPC